MLSLDNLDLKFFLNLSWDDSDLGAPVRFSVVRCCHLGKICKMTSENNFLGRRSPQEADDEIRDTVEFLFLPFVFLLSWIRVNYLFHKISVQTVF